MKAALLLATVLVFASSTSAKYRFNCLTSDKMLDVGMLDDFDAVWQHFYSSTTERGIISNKDYRTTNRVCTESKDDQELTVNVNIEGRWGDEGEVGHLEMRDAMLQAMWAFIQQTIAKTAYAIYTDCPVHRIPKAKQGPSNRYLLTRRAPTEEEICGPTSPNGDCPCPAPPDFWPTRCYGKKTIGHKLPNIFSIEVFDENGKLMAEELTVTVTTTMGGEVDGGCGVLGSVARGLATLIPVIGEFFDTEIEIVCSL